MMDKQKFIPTSVLKMPRFPLGLCDQLPHIPLLHKISNDGKTSIYPSMLA